MALDRARGKRKPMEWDRIASNWSHFKGNALRLASHIQQAYRLSSEQAEKQLASWQEAQSGPPSG